MRVLTWWMRGNGGAGPSTARHPWWKFVLIVIVCLSLLVAFVLLNTGFSIDDIRRSYTQSN